MSQKRDPRETPDEWDRDLDAFVDLMHASLVLLQPSQDFQMGLRKTLMATAAGMAAQPPQRAGVPRALLVGAAAALSLVGAAGAGAAAWWMWRSRPSHGSLLPARGS